MAYIDEEDLVLGQEYTCETNGGCWAICVYCGEGQFELITPNHPEYFDGEMLSLYGDISAVFINKDFNNNEL